MKTFFAAIGAFLLLFGVIVWNSFFVNAKMTRMESLLSDLPDCKTAATSFARVTDEWEHLRVPLSISVPLTQMREMDEVLAELRVAIEQKDSLQFETARARAIETARSIKRPETLCAECIL